MLEAVVAGLRERLDDLACVVVQRRQRRGAPSEVVFGALPAELYAHEAGLRFRLGRRRGRVGRGLGPAG